MHSGIGQLVGARVARLDDAIEAAVTVGDESRIGVPVGGPHADNDDRGGRRGAAGRQGGVDRRGADHRVGAEQDDDVAVELGERVARRQNRVSGAERCVLNDRLGRRHGLAHGRHSGPYHNDDPRRCKRRDGRQQMADHRSSGDLMHDLGKPGFHARADAGGGARSRRIDVQTLMTSTTETCDALEFARPCHNSGQRAKSRIVTGCVDNNLLINNILQ